MKSRLAVAGLYTGFFSVSFMLCLFFTFDARILGSVLEQAVRSANIKLAFDQARMSGLLGLELRGVEISPLNQPGGRPFKLTRLKLSPRLLSLPGAIWDARKKRPPRVAFSFSGWLGESGQRNLGGEVDLNPKSIAINLDIAGLPLDQLPPGLIRGLPPLSGKVNARLRLDAPDRTKTSTWDCTLKADFVSATVSDFSLPQMAGMKVPGFSLGNANLELEIKDGKGQIKSLRLTEGDVNLDQKGSFALPEAAPFKAGAINVVLTGTLSMTDENRTKLPLLASVIPPKGQMNYSGELRSIFPMLSSPTKFSPFPANPSAPESPGAPGSNAGFDPLSDPMSP